MEFLIDFKPPIKRHNLNANLIQKWPRLNGEIHDGSPSLPTMHRASEQQVFAVISTSPYKGLCTVRS